MTAEQQPETPLERARAAFGTYEAIARRLGVHRSNVSRLAQPGRRRRAGSFTLDDATTLVAAARAEGVDLTLADLVPNLGAAAGEGAGEAGRDAA